MLSTTREPLMEIQSNPIATPPNWNGSKYGLAGYWEWQAERDRGNGKLGMWAWFDNANELAAYQQQYQQKTKEVKGLAFKPVDLWIAGSVLFVTGAILGVILKELIKG